MPIDIPANATGDAVRAGDRRTSAERASSSASCAASLQPQSVAQLMRVLNETRRNNRIYVRLLTGTPGAVVNGEAMTALPAVGAVGPRGRPQRRQLHARSAAPPSASGKSRWTRPSSARACSSIDADGAPLSDTAVHRSFGVTDILLTPAIACAARCRRRALVCARSPCWCSAPGRVSAATPTFWTVATQTDFLKGDVEDLSIDSDGRVFARPVDRRWSPKPRPRSCGRWPALPDGTLLRRHRQRRQGAAGRTRRQDDAPSSTRPSSRSTPSRRRPDGGLYVGDLAGRKDLPGRRRRHRRSRSSIPTTSTSGRSPSIARQRLRRRPATRASSTASRRTASGRRFYRTNATQRGALAFDARPATCIAGTESPGRVFRIDAAGKAFVLLDSPFQEVHALRLAPRRHHLRRRDERRAGRGERPAERARRRARSAAGADRLDRDHVDRRWSTAPAALGTRRPPRADAARRPRGDLPDPARRRSGISLWDAGEDAPYDLAARAERQPARRHRHRGQDLPRRAATRRGPRCWRAPARGRSRRSLREPSGRIIGATSNPGKLFALVADPAARGTYESDVRDAGTVATWGVIRWRAVPRGRPGRVCHAHRQHRHAGRNLERVVGSLHARRRENRSPARTRATSSGAPCSPRQRRDARS